ncbi:hypothetical protein KDW_43850 [Dictyobacter vulcani]|uniref:HEAT repeat domain-containing protein n=1 Tax=Dictyobacter vulcani TaxID=2607529 RepID=A0A5J4KRG3_9CHLR|nr:hypothetical protein [Dictyobacter vulcani]GER90223.1 hypothetical protein KDW_43850 [Dictyobacter vulcani]
MPNITLSLWGKKTSSEELVIAAQAFLAEKDPKMIPGHLSIFRMRRFPLGHEKILQLAQSTDKTIVNLAIQALAHLQHPDIRTLAYQLTEASPGDSDALYLLGNNYYPEDYQFIEEIIRHAPEEELHSAAIRTIDIFTNHPTINNLKALTEIYERVPCAYCRKKAIHLLIEQDIFPIWMMEECLYDSNEDIQKLILTYMQKDTL